LYNEKGDLGKSFSYSISVLKARIKKSL